MTGNSTTITDPSTTDATKSFTFDYSYWSHDGFKEQGNGYFTPSSPHYADQVSSPAS